MGNKGYEDFKRSERFDEIITNIKIKTSDMIKPFDDSIIEYGKEKSEIAYESSLVYGLASVEMPPISKDENYKLAFLQGVMYHRLLQYNSDDENECREVLSDIETGKRPMINDSVFDSSPFYSVAVVPTTKPITIDLVMFDALTSGLNNDKIYSKSKRSVQLLTWLTLWNVETNEVVILDSFQWGCYHVVDEKTLFYQVTEPEKIPLVRIPNCAFFPKLANYTVRHISKIGNRIQQGSPQIKLLSKWHTSVSDSNINKNLK